MEKQQQEIIEKRKDAEKKILAVLNGFECHLAKSILTDLAGSIEYLSIVQLPS